MGVSIVRRWLNTPEMSRGIPPADLGFFNVLAGLIVLHLAAICWYAAKGNDLLSPMVGGTRPPLAGVSGIGPMPWGRGLLAIALAAGIAMWIVYGAPPLT